MAANEEREPSYYSLYSSIIIGSEISFSIFSNSLELKVTCNGRARFMIEFHKYVFMILEQ